MQPLRILIHLEPPFKNISATSRQHAGCCSLAVSSKAFDPQAGLASVGTGALLRSATVMSALRLPGGTAIAQAVGTNGALARLELAENLLGDDSGVAMAAAPAMALPVATALDMAAAMAAATVMGTATASPWPWS